ncbi:hypothetical protein NIES37_69340 (plasmid) [Tolypothrix tenuis PCC 7101]|uniref:Site-specific DNA-cytosine methylase n=1 Tax=Tolypothrix tenuis PCC 7101 TaxID=231146 RepID=A0A1Z4NB25_9CYAN|nr:hypothetical protein [Aulosira sp. FACHB-113]BAZ02921.1 hypothetical protein NIES37_69340 [Tolypothrix tenuis PCC 7101]BAZ78156.1 hypothetical protein NIES50_67890 [Aulosira laxa NIES-50]
MNIPPRKHKKATSTSSDLQPAVNPQNISSQDNQDLVTIDVPAVEVPELTPEEQSDRLHLERKVERAFFEAGKALAELRDRRLYRSTHRTFEEYCRDRFGHSRRQSYLLMDAAVVFDNLVEKCDRNDHILPTNEWQVRPLTKLDPDIQPQAWQQAVESANGKVPSHRIVKDIVQRIMERTQVPNTYQLGEVCKILAKDNPELRGKGGCWAIVTQVNDFTCTVRTWDGELTVGLKHLKPYEYLPEDCQQVQEICARINRVYSSGLEESVQSFLESLGKLRRAYLTDLEEKVLRVLETEMKD